MDTSNAYFITQTLKPDYYKFKMKNQLFKTYPLIWTILKKHCKTITLIPELTGNANIHYHGLIFFTDSFLRKYEGKLDTMKKFIKNKFRTIGFTDISKVKNYNAVLDYILKNIKETAKLLLDTRITVEYLFKSNDSMVTEKIKKVLDKEPTAPPYRIQISNEKFREILFKD
nr:rep protein [Cressdnaviricota sp.]